MPALIGLSRNVYGRVSNHFGQSQQSSGRNQNYCGRDADANLIGGEFHVIALFSGIARRERLLTIPTFTLRA